MHLITGRNVQEHQILLAVINLPYIVKGGNGGEKGNKGHKETNMMAGKGCVVRSKFTMLSKNPGGHGEVEIMKDDIWMELSEDYCNPQRLDTPNMHTKQLISTDIHTLF